MTLTEAQRERSMNLTAVKNALKNVHPLVQTSRFRNRQRGRDDQ